jgi:hypothetical protein
MCNHLCCRLSYCTHAHPRGSSKITRYLVLLMSGSPYRGMIRDTQRLTLRSQTILLQPSGPSTRCHSLEASFTIRLLCCSLALARGLLLPTLCANAVSMLPLSCSLQTSLLLVRGWFPSVRQETIPSFHIKHVLREAADGEAAALAHATLGRCLSFDESPAVLLQVRCWPL